MLQNKTKKATRVIPAYELAGYATYEHYLLSEEWEAKKEEISKRYPRSKYCLVCDSTKYLNLHHENYWAIPNEVFLKDVFWLCKFCHMLTHKNDKDNRLPLEKSFLRDRRKQLRKRHIIKTLRPSNTLYYIGRFIYRLFW